MSVSVEGGNRLPQSLQPLAEMAALGTGAEGFAVYQLDPGTGARELRFACGAPIPDPNSAGFEVGSFPLKVADSITGVLMFVFQGRQIDTETRTALERMAGAMEAVWRLTLIPSAYARSAARIGELNCKLADSKINDRARGVIASGASSRDSIDAMVRHVEGVLRPGQLESVLTQLTTEAERQIEERALANRAKAVLQTRYGMSEEQAHAHLRQVSRQSRKRLSDVARQFLRG